MKIITLAVFSYFLLSGTHLHALSIELDELTLSDGRTYKSVNINKKTPAGIRITHASGAGGIDYELLPKDLQKRLGGFNSRDALRFRNKEKAAQQQALEYHRRLARETASKAKAEQDRREVQRKVTEIARVKIEQQRARQARQARERQSASNPPSRTSLIQSRNTALKNRDYVKAGNLSVTLRDYAHAIRCYQSAKINAQQANDLQLVASIDSAILRMKSYLRNAAQDNQQRDQAQREAEQQRATRQAQEEQRRKQLLAQSLRAEAQLVNTISRAIQDAATVINQNGGNISYGFSSLRAPITDGDFQSLESTWRNCVSQASRHNIRVDRAVDRCIDDLRNVRNRRGR